MLCVTVNAINTLFRLTLKVANTPPCEQNGTLLHGNGRRVAVQIGPLPHNFEPIFPVRHLIQLAPRALERAMQYHHQLPFKGMKQHSMTGITFH